MYPYFFLFSLLTAGGTGDFLGVGGGTTHFFSTVICFVYLSL